MRRILAAAVLAFALASCEKSTGEIGLDFVDGSQFAFGTKSEVAMRTHTEAFDSLVTLRPAALLVGSYQDPIFGRPTASFATQLVLSSVAPDFGANPTVDSVFMILPYAGWYGDTTAAFQIKVQRSDSALTDSVYYAFSTVAAGETLCDTSFVPKAGVKTLRTGTRVGETSMFLKLSRQKFQEWIVDASTSNPSVLESNAAFLDYFNGLIISGGPNNETMYQFNPGDASAKVRIFYTNDSIRADTSTAGLDYGVYDLLWISGVQSFNMISHERSQAAFDLEAQDTVLGESSVYIQGLGGAVTVLNLDGLRALRDSGYVVNYAELVVPVREGSNLKYQAPGGLSVLQVKGSAKTLIRDYQRGSVGGTFSASGVLRKGAYRFEITRHVQDLLGLDTSSSYRMMLIPERMASSPLRAVLHGNADAVEPMSLNLWYTKPN
ncbi:MAG: DUF4270 domain-containing protein [Schleiferiaceae bacterium]|nr:DUF4270 domain-containing protein [Schleiferiaceae bacterium]